MLKLPTKPIYWVYKGKIIGFFIEIDDMQLSQGVALLNIQPISGLPPIDHIDLERNNFHGPWSHPTWDLRVDFVSNDYLNHMIGE